MECWWVGRNSWGPAKGFSGYFTSKVALPLILLLSVNSTFTSAVHATAANDQEIAVFQFQVLKNAKELEGLNAKAFCEEIGVPATYTTEFTKIISLARIMKEQGVRPV